MPMPTVNAGAQKRKATDQAEKSTANTKTKNSHDNAAPSSLRGPHQSIITTLSAKHNVLPLSVISSTKIHSRVSAINTHFAVGSESDKTPVAILYARPADVHKLITVVEQVKRVLQQEGRSWWQYNQLFEQLLPLKGKRQSRKDVVEETVLQGGEESSEEDPFEPQISRLEDAVRHAAPRKAVMSLRILVSTEDVSELRAMEGVTVQTSTDKAS